MASNLAFSSLFKPLLRRKIRGKGVWEGGGGVRGERGAGERGTGRGEEGCGAGRLVEEKARGAGGGEGEVGI